MHPRTQAPMPRSTQRVLWGLILACACAVLALSRWLSPHPAGIGTHEQLGLPPCGFYAWLGLPCPACGLTTAFAHLARGELMASIAAQPLGVPLFALSVALVPLSAGGLVRGASLGGYLERIHASRWAVFFMLSVLLVWLLRLWASG